MTKRSLVACLVALFCLSSGATATADPGGDTTSFDRGASDSSILALITDDDAFSLADLSLALATPLALGGANRTQHYGPYASDSPDSGTCGPDWANDTFDRHFTVRPEAGGFTVVQQFKRGAFETIRGVSPGSCDDGPPATVDPGIVGNMHGYFVITVTGTQISTDPSCVAGSPSTPCTTFGFMSTHFGSAYTIGTFYFHFTSSDQTLIERVWKNASDDRGGNHGDIKNTDVP